MDADSSVRKLAKEAKLSPSVIQDIRSGKQSNMKTSNLIKSLMLLAINLFSKKEKNN